MAPVVVSLRERFCSCEHSVMLVGTGQHEEILNEALAVFGLRLDQRLGALVPGQGLAPLLGRLLAELDSYLSTNLPHFVLAQGDTSSVFAAAICSFYRGIPFGHIEAGLRTGNLQHPFPEEFHRLATSIAANVHFAPTEKARISLLNQGVDGSAILVTGNTVIDAARLVPVDTTIVESLGIRANARLIVMTTHRRESQGIAMAAALRAVRAVAEAHPGVFVVLPVHPNPSVATVVRRELGDSPAVILSPPLRYGEMINLLRRAFVVVTDSGGIQEEAQFLGAPVLITRDHTERQEIVELGSAVLVGSAGEGLKSNLERLLSDGDHYASMAHKPSPYGGGGAAAKISEFIWHRLT
ncbi:UDP-N-acetylglucosamine 2-epimerase (non-hydrolyzing) [Mesorhizobium sp. M0322]